jgi:hypothetical protein
MAEQTAQTKKGLNSCCDAAMWFFSLPHASLGVMFGAAI